MTKQIFSTVLWIWVGMSLAVGVPHATAGSPGKAETPHGQGPRAALRTVADDGSLQLSPEDRCPVCGMFPAKRPKNAAAMVLRDGRTFYFCGNGCLLRSYRHTELHLQAPREAIRRMVVRDYFSGNPIDAEKAWWVTGSDVIGPMGPALVTLTGQPEVEQFRKRHGAKLVFKLEQMDDNTWRRIFPSK